MTLRSFRCFVFLLTVFAVVPSTLWGQSESKNAGDRLQDLFDSEWDRTMRESPTWASSLGDRRFNNQWPDLSLAAIEKSHLADRAVLEKLETIPVEELSEEEQINYRLFLRKYQFQVDAHPFAWYLVPLTQRGGIQNAGSTADSLRFEKVADYEDWIARMEAFPKYMDQTLALMRRGAETGVIHPRVIMERIPDQIQKQIVDEPEDHLFFKPFRDFPDAISESDQQQLTERAVQAINEQILPSYVRLQEFFENEYLPKCHPEVGVWQVPSGEELYRLRCRQFTTTELTPTQIHSIGLSEVARIRGEMEQIIEELNFEGSFADFLEMLRTDPRFYYETSDELLLANLAVCKKIDPQLVKLFKRLPRIPYGVEAIPSHIAPDTTTAYYRPPAADGTRAGTYFVNLYRPEVRPKYEIEALSLHESVPGHHLQIALAQELEQLPRFRRFEGYTAFVEGWGLYAESLGEDLGLYRDPYSKFGQLTYEMWRAVRLVVDTGMHHQRWSRQRAIDFFAENTAKTMLDIENEIDRYISWPGQALAYKIGELKIQELRRKSEHELGDQFDIREFHDVVLRNGAVTLDLLEEEVLSWIADTKQSQVDE
ncbi:DUF885 domain-containing protein [Thalassoglobus sp. JC818]|uniref:DUF885 domain-containing protein n=1 Tax=Thalassoglobus sp. JC818 TaxID=3232136 RepID=UPI0034579398